MSVADAASEGPTIDDLRKQLAAVSREINNLTGSRLGKVTAQIRDQPLLAGLIALSIGVIGGYLLKR